MLRRITAVLALALAAGLIAAGCGDDDDETTTTSTTTEAGATGATGATGASGGEPLSEEEFVEQGNAICSDVNQKLQGGPQSGSEEQFIDKTFIPAVEDGLADLGQLTPPEDLADSYQEMLDEGNKVLDDVKSDPSALGQGSFAKFDQLAGEVGLTECVD